MKKIILLATFISLFATGFIRGQAKDSPQSSLEKLFGRLKSAEGDSSRMRINDSIKIILDNYAKSDSVFEHTFRGVRNLGQIMSTDSKLKILTWNILLDNNNGWYFCYIIRKGPKGKENAIYKLEKKYGPEPILSDTVYNQSDWYGALYYDIKPFKTNGKSCFVLLGINYSDPQLTRKVIDILSFTLSDNLQFGLKCFNTGKGLYFRHVFEYSAEGVMSLRFRTSNSIIFDHLVPVPSLANEGKVYYGSDYSIDAFNLKDGFWKLILNIDARNKK